MNCRGSQASPPRFLCRDARGMHGWRHVAPWDVQARSSLDPDFCAEVLEACMVGGMMSHGWSRSASLSTQISVQTFSRHAWLEACCFMGGRGPQASRPGSLCRGARGIHGWRHDVSCMVEARRLLRLDVLQRCSRHAWLA